MATSKGGEGSANWRRSGQGARGAQGDGRQVLITLAALVIVLAGLRQAEPIVVPVLLAAFIAILTAPPVRWLEKHRVPTWLAVTLVLLGVLGVMALLGLLLGSSIPNFTQRLPEYRERLDVAIEQFTDWIDTFGLRIGRRDLLRYVDTERITEYAGTVVTAVGGMLSDTLFVLIALGFMLAEASGLPRKLEVASGHEGQDRREGQDGRELGSHVAVIHNIQRYLWIHTLISLANGVCAGLLCWAVGVEYAVLWGVLAFLLNYIPTIGSFLAGFAPTALALLTHGWVQALIIIVGYAAFNTVLDSIIEPRVLGKRLGLSALVVFLSMVFWGFVLGGVGMFLSVPLTMVVKMLFESSQDMRGVAVMLASSAEVEDRYAKDGDDEPPSEGTGSGTGRSTRKTIRRFPWYDRGSSRS